MGMALTKGYANCISIKLTKKKKKTGSRPYEKVESKAL